jgi:hypothetical protein
LWSGRRGCDCSNVTGPFKKEKEKEKDDGKLSCEYRVYLSVILEGDQQIVVGIHPKLAENLVEAALHLFTFQTPII